MDALEGEVDANLVSSENADDVLTNLINAYASTINANSAAIQAMDGTAPGQLNYWNGGAWVPVTPPPFDGATLKLISGIPTWVCNGDADGDGICDE